MNDVIVKELERLFKKHGRRITPEELVKEASIKTSPLYDRFEWDDTKAAAKWRIQQARQLLEIKIEYTAPSGGTLILPMSMSMSDDRADGKGYTRTVDILSDAEASRRMAIDRLYLAIGTLRNFPHDLTKQGIEALTAIIKSAENRPEAAE